VAVLGDQFLVSKEVKTATLFTELMFGPLGRSRALRLVHDGKVSPPPDTYTTIGMITRVEEGAPAAVRSQDHSDGLILRFRAMVPCLVWRPTKRCTQGFSGKCQCVPCTLAGTSSVTVVRSLRGRRIC
jgi:hypothetical protein